MAWGLGTHAIKKRALKVAYSHDSAGNKERKRDEKIKGKASIVGLIDYEFFQGVVEALLKVMEM